MYSLYITKFKPYLVIASLVVITTIVLWLPFILHAPTINGLPLGNLATFETVLKHWDGLLYIIPAKTLYDPSHPIMQQAVLGLEPKYFAAHLPLYPLSLHLFSWFADYPKSMLLSTMTAAVALFWLFYFIVKRYSFSKQPLLLTCVMLFIAPRFLVIRSVGSTEPLSMVLILLSIFAFAERKLFWAGIAGAFAIITRSPAVFLFLGYGLYACYELWKTKKIHFSYLWLLLIPAGLLTVFTWYFIQYGDFFVYFKGTENAHLAGLFSVFNHTQRWVGSAWIEDIVFYFFFYTASVMLLLKNIARNDFADARYRFLIASGLFAGIYLLSLYFVQHKDIARYSLPLLPFGIIAGERLFTKKWFIATLIILIFAIYMYSWNFMLINIAPVTDWQPFL